ncbi:MAG: ATP-dependent helicase [Sedimentibacter saalensis]|uniref:ATP-dependent helicase n=1 Tax=Sedimentibacter saalensis TaxID=130788 RepID=UPI002B21FD75|nr:ATP-dependent helicase [Sedimentibacter saalensis]MEA5096476.1 ATP-dependent helicase [Sedimentibacter saalensis]
MKEWESKLTNDYFREKLKQIESDNLQLRAYSSIGNTVVTAGPGSGKTTILTLKVMKLLSQYIHQPRGLACLTYSREAAREFQSRLKLLGFEKRNNVFLGTVHSFCLSEVLTPFSKLYPKYNIPTPIKIISGKEKRKLFDEIKNKVGFENLTIEEMDKERTRDISGFSKVIIPSFEVALKAALIYEKKLIENGYIDYISLVKNATLMIQNEDYIQKALEAKFPWLVIDEYQDLGKPLHEMVLGLLRKTNIKIFAVGDSDQSIYDFQGASPEYLKELSELDLIENRIHLINNYRSSKAIIEASELVLDEKRNYVAKGKLKDYDASIDFYVCEEDIEEQYIKAIDLIKKFNKEGVPYHEIAILAAYQNQLKSLAQLCLLNVVPYYMAKQDFERSDFIKWLENCASWITNPMYTSFDEIFQYWEYLLNNHNIKVLPNTRIFKKRELYDILTKSNLYNTSLIQWIDYVLNTLSVYKILNKSEIYPDEIENLEKLKSMLSQEPYDKYTLKQFTRLGSPENQVVLSSRHGSKGLEFDIVIMLGMEKDNFPRYNSTKREIEEAHRICFVCVSRARKKCILLRSKFINIPTRRGEIWHKSCEPSPFWNILYTKKSGC